MAQLEWKTLKRCRPWGPQHLGCFGKIPVVTIEDQNDNPPSFHLVFELPAKRWCHTFTTHRTLGAAKANAERGVSKWLNDARLRKV